MTSDAPLVYYPVYCFHLSPTINRWCPLRGSDIVKLERRSEFEVQDVYFHLNHPIRWVRITGVVVAIDEYYGRRIYTIDDSTGECVECCLALPKPADDGQRKGKASGSGASTRTDDKPGTAKDAETLPEVPADIDIGTVLEVKGSLQLFREQKQIKIQKVLCIRSTNQEVQFWTKIRDFRREVLSQPWLLDPKEVRRCRKLEQLDADTAERKRKKRHRAREEATDKKHSQRSVASRSRRSKTDSGAEDRASRVESTKPYAEGQYDALGL
ncbi:hypothetical protein F4780DRAFT_731812 [Xylariomycetidae sp. FL0641]|nr:hypothetical protein F4780DRAFT_731812 [Xylariomycetidae sp. FL0641]